MFFFFNDTATTEIYTLSLHDALPISGAGREVLALLERGFDAAGWEPNAALVEAGTEMLARHGHPGRLHAVARDAFPPDAGARSEEHTSELQSRQYLVCRLLLEKKKNK